MNDKQGIREFITGTTMHGVKYLNTSGYVRKIFWVILLICASCLAARQIRQQMRQLQDNPVSTNVKLVFKPNLTFPSITVCNGNPMRITEIAKYHAYSTMTKMNRILLNADQLDAYLSSDFLLLLRHNFTINVEVSELVSKFAMIDRKNLADFATLDQRFQDSRDFALNVSNQPEDMIISCLTNLGEPCHLRKLLTDFGVCYAINYNSSHLSTAKIPGFAEKFSLSLNVESYENIHGKFPYIGLKLLLHEQGEWPLVDSRGLNIPANMMTMLALKRKQSKLLPISEYGEHGSCIKSYPLVYFPKSQFNFDTCLLDNQYKMLTLACGCFPYMIPRASGEINLCSDLTVSIMNTPIFKSLVHHLVTFVPSPSISCVYCHYLWQEETEWESNEDGDQMWGFNEDDDPRWGSNEDGDPMWGSNEDGDPMWGSNEDGDPMRGSNVDGDPMWGSNEDGDPMWGSNVDGDPMWGSNEDGDPMWGSNEDGDPMWGSNVDGDPMWGSNEDEDPNLGILWREFPWMQSLHLERSSCYESCHRGYYDATITQIHLGESFMDQLTPDTLKSVKSNYERSMESKAHNNVKEYSDDQSLIKNINESLEEMKTLKVAPFSSQDYAHTKQQIINTLPCYAALVQDETMKTLVGILADDVNDEDTSLRFDSQHKKKAFNESFLKMFTSNDLALLLVDARNISNISAITHKIETNLLSLVSIFGDLSIHKDFTSEFNIDESRFQNAINDIYLYNQSNITKKEWAYRHMSKSMALGDVYRIAVSDPLIKNLRTLQRAIKTTVQYNYNNLSEYMSANESFWAYVHYTLFMNHSQRFLGILDKNGTCTINVMRDLMALYDELVLSDRLSEEFSSTECCLTEWNRTDIRRTITDMYVCLNSSVQMLPLLQQNLEDVASMMTANLSLLDDKLSKYYDKFEHDNHIYSDNLAQVAVYYREMTTEVLVQQNTYDIWGLLCDIGGTLGLCLGASAMTFCEFLDWTCMKLVSCKGYFKFKENENDDEEGPRSMEMNSNSTLNNNTTKTCTFVENSGEIPITHQIRNYSV